MGVAAVVKIQDFASEESVIHPVLKLYKGQGAPRLSEMLHMLHERCSKELPSCTTSHDGINSL